MWCAGLVAPWHLAWWDLPGPALAGGFLTAAPPGKSLEFLIIIPTLQWISCTYISGYLWKYFVGYIPQNIRNINAGLQDMNIQNFNRYCQITHQNGYSNLCFILVFLSVTNIDYFQSLNTCPSNRQKIISYFLKNLHFPKYYGI